jgi:hypothetical protein
MTLFGPHCSHDECGFLTCDNEPDPRKGVVYGCREQATCPFCGPTSEDWPRLATEWRAWALETYGTTTSADLQTRGVPPNVTATAVLIETHPPLRESGTS